VQVNDFETQTMNQKKYSAEEYQVIEESSEERFEFFNGEIIAMSGASKQHNRIVKNIANLLDAHFSPKGCDVYSETVKYKDEMQLGDGHFFPDVMVSCEDKDKHDPFAIRSPRVIVEVLSNGTALHDYNRKRKIYQNNPSLIYYLLINQYEFNIDIWRKEKDLWISTVVEGADAVVNLPLINLYLSAAEIYKSVNFIAE
jgi:Uma2 family endonuclease